MQCSGCDGLGAVEKCVVGHVGNCPCAARDVECAECGGYGRKGDVCGEPAELPYRRDGKDVCRSCDGVHPCAGGCGAILAESEKTCGYCAAVTGGAEVAHA